ncbi:MAG: hypothetical protein OIF47_09025 [Marinibacterium sp.]|nr:hypothetical protein [Marinibacterium sp.]
MNTPTSDDWGKVHAKAWQDPEFKALLESNPREAMDAYCEEQGKPPFDKIVLLGGKPDDALDHLLHEAHQAPPACC